MVSVTQRIRQIKQPYGGYLKPSDFEVVHLSDNKTLSEDNISSVLVGLAVDYLTRVEMGASTKNSFKISLMGASLIGQYKKAHELLDKISGTDNVSIQSACKLVGYDVVFRAGPAGFKNIDEINPDSTTISNIRIMVNRSIMFFAQYGPVVKDGFTFEGGYTKTINAGDGDFLTSDTLWDFKVSKNRLKSPQTLQLLIYYIMGVHSIHDEFTTIKKLGIFNPRLNLVYLCPIENIDKQIIRTVEEEVICYSSKTSEVYTGADTLYTVTDLTRVLGCSRYTVMKHYSQDGLPLFRYKNKYVIKRGDLLTWVREMEEKRKRQQAVLLVVFGIILLLTWLSLSYIFRR